MMARLRVVLNPPDALMQAVEAFEPENPIQRAAYARSRGLLGERVCAVVLEMPGSRKLVGGCFAYLVGRTFAPSMIVSSLPPLADLDAFVKGLLRWCRFHGVWVLHAETFCSEVTHAPSMPGETGRRQRCEWIWRLPDDPVSTVGSHHKRNISKARKAGVEVRRSRDVMGAQAHARLLDDSMARRAKRGEAVPQASDAREWSSVLETGAAELFQGVLNGEVVTSLLVLRTATTAYYLSAGTSPSGFSSGAAPLVVLTAAQMLRVEGTKIFNLAGAGDEAPGLQRYKRDFGAHPRYMDAAWASALPRVLGKARTAARLLFTTPRALVERVAYVERMLVYSAETRDIAIVDDGVVCTPLEDAELSALRDLKEFAAQARRFEDFGLNAAFALRIDGQLAHVAWLLSADDARRADGARHLPMQGPVAEITHCHTAEAFRGRGIYPRAIRLLAEHARIRGIVRVYMATSVNNVASQRGIEKAGLQRCGEIRRYRSPLLDGRKLLERSTGDIGRGP